MKHYSSLLEVRGRGGEDCMSKIRASHIVGFCASTQPLDTAEAEIKIDPPAENRELLNFVSEKS